MTPQELKNSILQLAIQGKLAEQRPEEGTAEELYRQIQEEKQKLIKEGKIKKEKPLPEITEDEKPFDIPETWKWVRWGSLSESIQYGYNAPALDFGRIKMVRISDIQDDQVQWGTVPYCDIGESDIPTYLLKANDILFARTGGTVGKSFLVKQVPCEAVYAGYLIRTRYSSLLSPEYLKSFMGSQLYWRQLRNGTIATAQPNCNGNTLARMIVPLPPLAEQKRIVAKIEELLPLIDRYEKAWTRLEEFNKRFPDDLQKSLLQMAIQGKLVEQRPEEGTGKELYQQIQKEKQELIRAGKIKKEKPLPEITEDEKPFDIPESWKWYRIGDVFDIINGFTPLKSNPDFWTNGTIPWFTIDDVHRQGRFIEQTEKFISERALSKSTDRIVPPDTVLLCCTASVGEYAYAKISLTTNQQFNALVTKGYFKLGIYPLYIFYFVQTLKDVIIQKAGKTTFSFLSVGKLSTFLVPLPPLAEQKRIVAKLEELLPLCEKLKS